MNPDRHALRRQIAQAGRWFLLAVMIVSLALPYWSLGRAEILARAENVRPLDEEARTMRGRIVDINGLVLARSEADADGYVKRFYASPALAHVVGYWSMRYGVAGIEAARNSDLRGDFSLPAAQQLLNRLLHRPVRGNDVVLTIDSRVQQVADSALGSARGAIVVLNVRTGAVVALVSHPSFDANRLDADIERLKSDLGKPLLNRATHGLYSPGSTFKTITLAAALDKSIVAASTVFTYALRPPDRQHTGWWHLADQKYECQNHPANNSPFDLTGAYIWSCNVAFGDIALDVGADSYNEIARRFGLGRPIPFDLPTVSSQLYRTPGYLTGQERFYALASTGFGQGEITVTPLQMTLAAAAIANDGKMPEPYLVARVQSPDGRTLDVARPRVMSTVLSSPVASIVRQMMVDSVEDGWARPAAVGGVSVGGKTGTAETIAGQSPHSWFIGFAPGDSPLYAVAVVMEQAGFGSTQAAPAAKRVLESLLR